MWSIIILFWLLLPFTSLRNHAAHNWLVWIQLSNLEQSALFWHQAIGYSVGKIDVFWKTFDKVREVKLKNGFSNILIILRILLLTLMSMLSSTRKLGSKGSTLSKLNLDMMKNSSHRDGYPAMQSNGPLPQVGYSVGKIDVFWKTFDKVRGKIVKIIKIFEKLEHITHFGSKMTSHLLCRH